MASEKVRITCVAHRVFPRDRARLVTSMVL